MSTVVGPQIKASSGAITARKGAVTPARRQMESRHKLADCFITFRAYIWGSTGREIAKEK